MAYFEAFELKAYQDSVQLRNGLILDLGCGDGTFAEMLKELLGFTSKLVGIDLDQTKLMRAMCRQMLYRQVLHVDGSHLPFKAGSFDAVVANAVLYCVSATPDAVIAESERVLKKNGQFICTVPTSSAVVHHYIGEFLQMIGMSWLERPYTERVKKRFGFVSAFPLEQWCMTFEKHGLKVQRVVPFISDAISRRWSILTLTPFRVMGLLRSIPLVGIGRIAAEVQKRLMGRSYEHFSMAPMTQSGDYALVVCRKV